MGYNTNYIQGFGFYAEEISRDDDEILKSILNKYNCDFHNEGDYRDDHSFYVLHKKNCHSCEDYDDHKHIKEKEYIEKYLEISTIIE